eukprot:9572710-Karenia_brevis.AAC.1
MEPTLTLQDKIALGIARAAAYANQGSTSGGSSWYQPGSSLKRNSPGDQKAFTETEVESCH